MNTCTLLLSKLELSALRLEARYYSMVVNCFTGLFWVILAIIITVLCSFSIEAVHYIRAAEEELHDYKHIQRDPYWFHPTGFNQLYGLGRF